MRVFILGAGFSHEAGYPLASQLLTEMARLQRQSPVKEEADRWREFEKWRECQIRRGDPVASLCKCGNPEYLFTYLDLASMAAEARWYEVWSDALSATRDGGAEAAEKRDAFRRQPLSAQEREVRQTLLKALWHFFGGRNHKDHGKESEWAGGGVLEFFNQYVEDGDVVVTFNYDSVPERCLLKLAKWHPSTGYGFRKVLAADPYTKGILPAVPSAVSILKLHGSVGWRRGKSRGCDTIVLEPTFFSGLGESAADTDAPPGPWATQEVCLLLPSFVKVLDHPIISSIWYKARRALESANEVVVVGYSLPDADQAGRALLASTLCRRRCPIVLVDPDFTAEVRPRYELALGRPVVHQKMEFGKWVTAGCPTSQDSS